MQSTVEHLSPTSVRLTVEVPFEELEPRLAAAYKKIAAQVNIPGFRRGKVPPPIIDQRIGRELVLDQAVQDAVPDLYLRSVQDNDVEPLGQPEIEVTELEDGQRLTFTAELDVRPQVQLPSYDGLQVQVQDVEVTDAEVEEQLQALRERFGTLVEVDREAAEGDFVTIDLRASKDGRPVEDAQASDLSYQVGSGGVVEGLDDAVRGMRAGDTTTFGSSLVAGELAGQPVDVEVTVRAVKRQELPEVDDEFAQLASEFDTVEELTVDLRSRLGRGKRLEQASAARDAVLVKLLELVDVPLPDRVVAAEVEARRESIRQQLAYAGLTEQQYLDSQEQTEDEFAATLEKRARDALAAQFVLDEIARAEKLGVEEHELSEHVFRRAQQAGLPPQEYAKHVRDSGQAPTLVSEVVRGKALALVVESAEVTDASGRKVELTTLQPDGTYAEPAGEPEPEPVPADSPSALPQVQV